MQFRDKIAELDAAIVEKTEMFQLTNFPDRTMKHVRGSSKLAEDHFAWLSNFLEGRGWMVQTNNPRGGSDYGWCIPELREVYVGPSWKNQMFFNLIHEGTHALELEKTPIFVIQLRGLYDAEVIADSTAYVVADYCGLSGNLLERASHYLSVMRGGVPWFDELARPLDYTSQISALAETILVGMGY